VSKLSDFLGVLIKEENNPHPSTLMDLPTEASRLELRPSFFCDTFTLGNMKTPGYSFPSTLTIGHIVTLVPLSELFLKYTYKLQIIYN
jgi:hypothetical protein